MHKFVAWARNALPFTMPENVAFGIGNNNDLIQYLVLQIHYAQPFHGNVRDFSGFFYYANKNF